MIRLTDLKFVYGNRTILNIPHWSVEKGKQLFMYGDSGSGKSTLLQVIAGLIRPANGQIEVCEQNIDQLSPASMDHFRARNIGLISQQLNLIPYLSAMDNVLLAASLSGLGREFSKKELKTKASALLNEVRIDAEIQQQKAEDLSLGQQQRVAIVRALIHAPEIILADEPTSALDPQNRDLFMTLLLDLCTQQKITLILVSHDHSLRPWFEHHQAITEFNQLEIC